MNPYYTAEQVRNFPESRLTFLLHEQQGHILTLTLNRPEKKNALHPIMVVELAYALAYTHYTPEVRVVVLRANGSVFCAGADLRAFSGGGEDVKTEAPDPSGGELRIGDMMSALHKPCIAAVHASAYAGAFLLLCGCTHVVAANMARFGLPEVRRGIFPFQVMASLLEVMPPRQALDWCMQGYELSAEEACTRGLVTEVCAPEALDQRVAELAEALEQSAPAAIKLGLEAYAHLRRGGSAGQHGYLQEMLFKALQTADAQEGIRAFAEKRSPNWTGR
jgi:enoyl-CoA hydratase/carnithine racemase